MAVVHGFERVEERNVAEVDTKAERYRHVKTGAELLSMVNKDENKVFGIVFRTPPSDGTGVAHILEHSVLCGSRKYPVKEPFVELLKGSLQTFLNAFTYPDKTCYPVASQNLQDFYNLIDVYLDAVFHPRITPHIFQQEGWHLAWESPDKPPTFKGVVYNEMKGACSSPDRLLAEYSQQALFPDNTYGLDSGGDPKEIPRLSYEQFKAFHDQYYHPSNARIFFSGDDDPVERLRLLDAYLKDYDRLEVDSTIPLQRAFDAPRKRVFPMAVSEGEQESRKGMITVNWLLGETTDTEMNLALQVLNYVLLGMPASPLRKALIDSGLGEDVVGGGLEVQLRQMCFSTGLKGIEVTDADRVEALVLDTLTRLAGDGIDPLTVEAALNTIEFALRENNTGSFPRGLSIMLRALTTWLYDGDPLELIAFEKALAALKSRLSGGPGYFGVLIQKTFLDNPHRVTVILEPDPDLSGRLEAEEQARLEAAVGPMSAEERQASRENAAELKRLQGTPDPPEALASLPFLKKKDLDRKNKMVPSERRDWKQVPLLYHDLPTNGIAYLDVGFNLKSLPQEVLPYVPLLGRAFLEMGTDKEDFVSLTQRIGRTTGGIHRSSLLSAVRGSDASTAWLFLRGKAVETRARELTDILRDVLLSVRLDNQERFRQMVLEEKARQEQRVVPEGHQLVNLRMKSHFREADWLSEQMGGVSYLFFLRGLADAVDKDWPGVLRALQTAHHHLVTRDDMLVNVTVAEEGWSHVSAPCAALLESLPEKSARPVSWAREAIPEFEGLTIPAQVNYVGKAADIYELGYRFHASSQVITRYLRTAWLWDRVRVQGGAYGAFCGFGELSGVLTYVSYRDPNLEETLKAFDGTADFLRDLDLSAEELEKSIIGAIGDMDSHMLPDAKGYASMVRHLIGDTEEDRQRRRDEILGTTATHFKDFAEVLARVREKGIVKVLGSAGVLESAKVSDGKKLHLTKVL